MTQPSDDYTLGYSSSAVYGHAARTATIQAEFALPMLRPGMRVLDCGCGPGSITLGLAERAAPGLVVGIDIHASQPAIGRAAGANVSITNAAFAAASVYALPFASGSFDLIFVSAVLGHLSRPDRALAELMHVLAPEGYLAIREFDLEGALVSPQPPGISRAIALCIQLMRLRGQNPTAGRDLPSLLHQAGFQVLSQRGRYDTAAVGAPTRTALLAMNSMLLGEVGRGLVELGLASKEEIAGLANAWIEAAEAPGAFWASAWCEAIAVRPLDRKKLAGEEGRPPAEDATSREGRESAGYAWDAWADLLVERGQDAEAEAAFRRALSLLEGALMSGHPDVANIANKLCLLLVKRGALTEATALVSRSVAATRDLVGRQQELAIDSDTLGLILTIRDESIALATAIALART